MATKDTKAKKATTTTPKKEAAQSAGKEEQKVRYSTLNINGDKYRTLLTEKYKNRQKWENPDHKKVVSDIPGTVISVYVKEGQEVKEGDMMMVLEAMKMKNKIYFHMDGVVKKIYVSENEKIPKNHLMIELK